MGSGTTNNSFSSNYTSNYTFDTGKAITTESWFSVSHGSTIYTYSFPPGMVQAVFPDTITDKTSVFWNSTTILNRTGQLWSYSGTGDRTCSFSFDLAEDSFIKSSSHTVEQLRQITQIEIGAKKASSYSDLMADSAAFDLFVAGLRKTIYPEYEKDVMYPPLTTFCFGEFKIRGFVQNISFTWKKPIINNRYSKLNVSVDMVQLQGKVTSASYFDSSKSLNPFQL